MMMNREQVIARLKQGQGKRSLRSFAAAMGITAPYLCAVYAGSRPPSPKILEFMGLRRQVTVLTIYITE